MAPIDSDLLKKTMDKLGLGKSRVYALIDAKVRDTSLPRHVAALLVARDAKVNFSRFASETDLAMMRGVAVQHSTVRSAPTSSVPSSDASISRETRKPKRAASKPNQSNRVFVVHGRNKTVRKGLFDFLRAVGLDPVGFEKAGVLTGTGTPYIGRVLDTAFAKVKAIIVLFTPDDEAKLKDEFFKTGDRSFERELTGQPRPNVIFEAGMAFGRQPDRTILVHVGKIRPISDIEGRHFVQLTNSVAKRHQLLVKLETIGLKVDYANADWQDTGEFEA